MKKKIFFGLLVLTLVTLVALPLGGACAATSPARAIDPLVSTDWLADNLGAEDLVILDVRSSEEYELGHITGAINSPEGNWYINPPFVGPEPWMELPPVEDLFATIGNAGITGDSLVVVVGRTAGPMAVYALAGTTRVADTLLYAGVRNVAVLDGGYDKWAAEKGRAVSTDPVTPASVTYTGKVDKAMFVSKDYVEKKIGKSIIVDARDADVYFGVTLEPWATAGHISSATCLPSPWLWTFAVDEEGVVTYGTYKDTGVITEMASGVIGENASKEIIVYCGIGGYASTAYFVLSEVVGYKNVKIYDGSAQEWTADPAGPVVVYEWE